MRLRVILLLSLMAALSPRIRPPLAADERPAANAKADQFEAEIKKLGGYVHRDKQRPGGPVVAVDLRGSYGNSGFGGYYGGGYGGFGNGMMYGFGGGF